MARNTTAGNPNSENPLTLRRNIPLLKKGGAHGKSGKAVRKMERHELWRDVNDLHRAGHKQA